ncbi:sodium-dependent transporter [Alkalicoccobacillus porphyridii]|uniref:Transporter n=1 Tax=Alkalicoccobacillus porphyridii TaxID=2597270 RepID=A0A554A3F8_9BACI|nr:sodium-dependent transporter [Alkalicoccobacillus porphyridii]TSB48222.1 sodium-dependent transporter [Alkalicoccobacillus porphyridii]
MAEREQWGSRAGFVLAAIGSAVGLGNIWRFPYVAYDNGGGAFLIPYLFALLTAGIPILIMEFTMGQRFRGSSPLTYARINKKAEWMGWWQVGIAFVISTYYSVIIAWAISYTYFSFSLSWGDDPGTFLMTEFLQATETTGTLGSLVPGVLLPLLLVWVVTLGILFKGVKKGIELANRVLIPALIFMFLCIVVRALTLEGAALGLDAFFKPEWSGLLDSTVWVAAYGHIFFSLSVAFAIMITYSSYLPKKADINNNAFITAFSNSGFEILAGIGVFAVLGFMAVQSGLGIDEVADGGVGLAFVVFPQIINTFPGFNEFFGVLFFGCLVLAGITSLISIVETYVAGIQDKFNVSRTKAVMVGGGLSALISLLYATQNGVNVLDAVDYFINNFGIAVSGLVTVVAMGWVLKKLPEIKDHTNQVSDFRIGSWWTFCLMVVTPVILGIMFVQNLYTNLTSNYEDLPTGFLITFGWSVAVLAVVFGFVVTAFKWQTGKNKLTVEQVQREGNDD